MNVLTFKSWKLVSFIHYHYSHGKFFLQKSMSGGNCERILAVLWNFIALFLVLSLCLLSWYSRLYTSWACVTDSNDILIFCQFTNQVHGMASLSLSFSLSLSLSLSLNECSFVIIFQIQCYRCEEAVRCTNLEQCVQGDPSPYHCLTPLYTVNPKVCLIASVRSICFLFWCC